MLAYERKRTKIFEIDGCEVLLKLAGDEVFVFVETELTCQGMSFNDGERSVTSFFDNASDIEAAMLINMVRNGDSVFESFIFDESPTLN